MFGSYGPSWIFCWIDSEGSKGEYLLVTSLLLYIPFMVSFVFNIACFIKSYRFLKAHVVEEVSFEFYRLLLYPLISFTCNAGGFVYALGAIYGSSQTRKEDYTFFTALRYYHLITRQLQGLFTAIAYGMNHHVRTAIKQQFKTFQNNSRVDSLLEEDDDLECTSTNATMSKHKRAEKRAESVAYFLNNREELISKYFNIPQAKSMNFLD